MTRHLAQPRGRRCGPRSVTSLTTRYVSRVTCHMSQVSSVTCHECHVSRVLRDSYTRVQVALLREERSNLVTENEELCGRVRAAQVSCDWWRQQQDADL